MSKLKQSEVHTITRIVTSESGEETFRYTKELQGVDGKHAIFLMLYPTRNPENFHVQDSTAVHIENHLKELGLNSYTVVNLFSKVTQSRLSVKGLAVDNVNLEYIEKEVFSKTDVENTVVVIAWGNSHLTSKAVNLSKQKVLESWLALHPEEKLYQLTADGMDKDNYGVHPLYMGIRYSNAIWKLSPYPVKKALEQFRKEEGNKTEDKKDSKSDGKGKRQIVKKGSK